MRQVGDFNATHPSTVMLEGSNNLHKARPFRKAQGKLNLDTKRSGAF
jgi:hypothetical protein